MDPVSGEEVAEMGEEIQRVSVTIGVSLKGRGSKCPVLLRSQLKLKGTFVE